jgi:hypothetical protein
MPPISCPARWKWLLTLVHGIFDDCCWKPSNKARLKVVLMFWISLDPFRFRSDLNQSRSSIFQKRATHHRILRMSQFVGIRNSPSLNLRLPALLDDEIWDFLQGMHLDSSMLRTPRASTASTASSLSIWRRIGLHNYCAEQTSSTMLSCAEIPITCKWLWERSVTKTMPNVHQKPSFVHVEARGRVVSRGTKPVQVWTIAPVCSSHHGWRRADMM